jgi:RNA polymerase sigma factor (sigma-70 family)
MAGDLSVELLRNLHALFDNGTASGLSDRQLLERFAETRDASAEAAFEILLLRHGPMVLRVCSSALRDPTDAQDAFQATFLVLVRRSRAIRKRESVGSWLYGVAYRVSARARFEAARRRAAERRGALRVAGAENCDDESAHDRHVLGQAIREEVERLPEKYRAVVVLCYWQGLTQEQAAAQLGRPLGTVRSRLARGRALLHRRLTRRGLAPLAGLVTAALDGTPTEAAGLTLVPSTLARTTARAAARLVSGRAISDVVSMAVAVLVQQTIRSIFMMKVKTIVLCGAVIGVGAFGASVAAPQASFRKPAAVPSRAADRQSDKSKAQPGLVVQESYVVEPPDVLVVEVLEALPGRPISGERLVRPDGKISLGFYGDVYVAGLTVPEIKEKVVRHLQKYLGAETLGLLETDRVLGEPVIDAKARGARSIDPRDSDRVFVDVTAYNSKCYYVLGEVFTPGRFPVKGIETVLDVVNLAGGLTPAADRKGVVLYRHGPSGGPLRTMRVDIEQITMGDDLSTNYQLQFGDRLVVPRNPRLKPDTVETDSERPKAVSPRRSGEALQFDRRADTRDDPRDVSERADRVDDHGAALLGLERRLSAVERKLDLILEALRPRTP